LFLHINAYTVPVVVLIGWTGHHFSRWLYAMLSCQVQQHTQFQMLAVLILGILDLD
jgi:hypothetical protein